MQSSSSVKVVRDNGRGRAGQVVGQAELVRPDVAVMETGNRGPEPILPLLVLFPVAAGGDREERAIVVTEVVPAEDGAAAVALRLAEPVGHAGGPDHVHVAALADLQVETTAESRLCRWFPWLCR